MLKLVTIDLSSADIGLFESYEKKVIPLLEKYNAKLELSVRSIDGVSETHVLFFPDAVHFGKFLLDPTRVSLQDQWMQTGVTSTISDVVNVDYL